jgi:serine/threonine protein kinase
MVPAMHDATGAGRVVAGRYELLATIGLGATGTVWRARDLVGGRDVAIKELHVAAPLSEQDPRIRHARSLREARVAARLRHPGVVTVQDVIEADGNPWIVMDLVAGTSLAQVLADSGPVPAERAAQLGTTLLGALASAHAAGIVHRDVKPANVLITSAGQAVLTDFGLAVLAGEPQLTQAGMVMGTPGFCAPERIRGQPASPASDLWSLGATLYAAVAGEGPFDGRGSLMAILASIVHDDPPRPPPAAGRLGPVIAALMSKDPAARPDAAIAAGMLADVGGERAEPATATAAEAGPGRAEPGRWRPGRHRRTLARST